MNVAQTALTTWRLDQAIQKQWDKCSLDSAFRRRWPVRTATEYQPLSDGYAMPAPPGPYCVYEKLEPAVVANMTGLEGGEERQVMSWPFRFEVHAKENSKESAKEVARWLAERVAEAFDPHNEIEIEGAAHIVTERGPDWHDEEGEDECVWTLEFKWLVDGKVRVSYAPSPEESTSSTAASTTSSSVSSSSSSTSTSGTLIEEDDVLDFADIGGVYDSLAAAVANSAALRTYIASRVNDSVALKFGGPRDYGTKRQPGVAYLDLSAGEIAIGVGGAGNLTSLVLEGSSKVQGVNAATDITPIFKITRGTGSTPIVVLRDLTLQSDGSVLKLVYGGSGFSLENLKIEDFSGTGTMTQDDFNDVDDATAAYGLWIDDADGCHVQNLQIAGGSGHGVVVDRLHCGELQARVRNVGGIAFKLGRCNNCRMNLWAEGAYGYALYAKDCGMERYVYPNMVVEMGGPNDWLAWFENNNGRGTTHTTAGYSFSQFKLESCARVQLRGHTGWRVNMCRLERFSRVRNVLEEELRTDVSDAPNLELVTGNTVDPSITLPAPGYGYPSITNWAVVWPNAAYRPTALKVGTPGVDERIRITWPAGCFDNAVGDDSAYWRPYGSSALISPGLFYYEVQVQDMTGAIATYCAMRESKAVRQGPYIADFHIAPVAGGLAGFALWDQKTRQFSGSVDIDSVRDDISPTFVAWMDGMQNAESGDEDNTAPQDIELQMDILQWRMWKIAG